MTPKVDFIVILGLGGFLGSCSLPNFETDRNVMDNAMGNGPMSMASPQPQIINPVPLGMDVVNGDEMYRLNFLLNFNASVNSTKNTSTQPITQRDEILHALRDSDSKIHAILQSGKTGQVLRKILQRRGLTMPTNPSPVDGFGIRVYEDTAASLSDERRISSSMQLSTQVHLHARCPAIHHGPSHVPRRFCSVAQTRVCVCVRARARVRVCKFTFTYIHIHLHTNISYPDTC
jgi:hypothetical protein